MNPQEIPKPVSMLSSNRGMEEAMKLQKQIQDRIERRRMAVNEEANLKANNPSIPTPTLPKGNLSPQEAKTLFKGDLTGLQYDEGSNSFTPSQVHPEDQQRVTGLRTLNSDHARVSNQLANLSRRVPPPTASILSSIGEMLNQRKSLLESYYD